MSAWFLDSELSTCFCFLTPVNIFCSLNREVAITLCDCIKCCQQKSNNINEILNASFNASKKYQITLHYQHTFAYNQFIGMVL